MVRPAVADGAGHGGLDRRLAAQFLPESRHHEQAVVDAQAKAHDRGDVHRVDGDRGGEGEQPQHGEGAEDRQAPDRDRKGGGHDAAEDQHQQDQQDGQRDALGAGDAAGDRAVDGDLGGHGAAHLGGDPVPRPASQVILDGFVGVLPGGIVRARELQHGVSRVPVGGDEAGLPARPVRGGVQHVRSRQGAELGRDGLPVSGVGHRHRGAVVQHHDVRLVPPEHAGRERAFRVALAARRRERVA